ncbi:hypothetical protein MVES1_002723 [Malassezia vespertilionis]|uniref:Uncharacterized protein n=1 Tax=Malassezia vespertilionis TaxID=2020962 RepID=A0A2N1JB42_9BASI|nr:uncharacterized protein MVES1_002723 [Malassezia vespertilionis]PKI83771.1 hypothetical protein MVES_002571 [Malassezia vespertilionis]WFD07360.1 hypothetical protein MVES1_002723 [Malassezia vespertilionis]
MSKAAANAGKAHDYKAHFTRTRTKYDKAKARQAHVEATATKAVVKQQALQEEVDFLLDALEELRDKGAAGSVPLYRGAQHRDERAHGRAPTDVMHEEPAHEEPAHEHYTQKDVAHHASRDADADADAVPGDKHDTLHATEGAPAPRIQDISALLDQSSENSKRSRGESLGPSSPGHTPEAQAPPKRPKRA